MNEFLFLLALVGGIALAVQLAYLTVRAYLDRRRTFWKRRLDGSGEDDGGPLLLTETTAAGPPPNWSGKMDHAFVELVQQTGLGWSSSKGLAMMALLGVLLGGLMYLWRGEIGLVPIGLVAGLVLPLVAYVILRARWRLRIQDQLPDTFFLLARSLRAGLSLDQALATAAQHGNQPMADELRRCVEQIRLGLSVPAALQGVARRLKLPDFDVFVLTVTLHRSTGGNLTELLDRLAIGTRDRNLFRGYFRAATALSRITGVCIAAAAPLLFVGYLIWQPEFAARFTQSTSGLRALTTAACLEIVGSVWLVMLLRRVRY